MSEDPFEDIEKMLSTLFGAQVAGDAVAALRSSGIDPTQLAQMSGVDMSRITPVQLLAVQEQMQRMMKDGQEGPVNWTMGRDLALQGARRGGDPADAPCARQQPSGKEHQDDGDDHGGPCGPPGAVVGRAHGRDRADHRTQGAAQVTCLRRWSDGAHRPTCRHR